MRAISFMTRLMFPGWLPAGPRSPSPTSGEGSKTARGRRPSLARYAPALLLAPALAAGCAPGPDAAPKTAEGAGPPVARVTAARPERATVRRTTEQPGQVEAFESAPIQPRVAGYVRSVAVDIGDRVKKGQTLAVIDAPDVEAAAQQKRAAVEQAEAERAQAEASVEVAKAALASAQAKAAEVRATTRRTEADLARWQAEASRIEQLTRESAVTGSLRDETRSKLESARAAHDESAAKVRSAEAALAEAKSALDKSRADLAAAAARIKVAAADARQAEALFGFTRLLAPFDGVVARRDVDPGHLTAPGGGSAAGAVPLFVVDRDDKVTISVAVPEADAAHVQPGDPVEVSLPALDGGAGAVAGKVTRTSWALDRGTRTLRAEMDLDNPEGRLRPGLYAHARIVAEEHAGALTVPASAVVRDGAKRFCLVVADGRARRVEVRTGIADGPRVEVVSGLDPGDLVVTAGAESLTDGQPVRPVQPDVPAKPAAKP